VGVSIVALRVSAPRLTLTAEAKVTELVVELLAMTAGSASALPAGAPEGTDAVLVSALIEAVDPTFGVAVLMTAVLVSALRLTETAA
jgi:hypothetical protein